MTRYDSYKDSGVEWIGEIPSHWVETKLKNLGQVTLGKMLTKEDKGGFSLRPYLRSFNVQVETVDVSDVKEMWFSDHEMSELRLVRGDLLFNEGGDVGRTSIWNEELPECYIQNSVNRVRFDGNSRYFLYVSGLHHGTGYYDSQVNRVSIPHLTKEKLENVLFPSPPTHEQEQIVEYLDRKTTLIDSLIEKKVRKIELLKEKRTSLINEVVTKGLNPDVEMKDSGVEWIGEIPSHWNVKRLQWISDIENSGVWGEDDPFEGANEVPIPTTAQLSIEGRWDYDGMAIRFLSDEERDKYLCRRGDVVVVKSSGSATNIITGKCGYIDETDDKKFGFSNFLLRVRTSSDFHSRLTYYFLQSNLTKQRIERMVSATTYPNLKVDEYVKSELIVPPLHEQEQIVEYLDEQKSIIDSTITNEEKRIELLKEYRQSLISEVTTGKIKVA